MKMKLIAAAVLAAFVSVSASAQGGLPGALTEAMGDVQKMKFDYGQPDRALDCAMLTGLAYATRVLTGSIVKVNKNVPGLSDMAFSHTGCQVSAGLAFGEAQPKIRNREVAKAVEAIGGSLSRLAPSYSRIQSGSVAEWMAFLDAQEALYRSIHSQTSRLRDEVCSN